MAERIFLSFIVLCSSIRPWLIGVVIDREYVAGLSDEREKLEQIGLVLSIFILLCSLIFSIIIAQDLEDPKH